MNDIKLLVMDVDGTLTDGKMYIDAEGKPLKAFDVKDGYGIAQILPNLGITPAIITGNSSFVVQQRANDLKIDHCYQGIGDKLGKLKTLQNELNIDASQIAYIGDDLNDLECIKYCGFTACPSDAVIQVKKAVNYVCTRCGGNGAVRELIDLLASNV